MAAQKRVLCVVIDARPGLNLFIIDQNTKSSLVAASKVDTTGRSRPAGLRL